MKPTRASESHFGLNFIATGEDTNGRYFQCSTVIPAGDGGPPVHKHAHESEGFYVLSGSITLAVDGREWELKPGDFFNVPPGAAHTWRNGSEHSAELIITFSPSGIEDMFRKLDEPGADFEKIGNRYGMTTIHP
ncbi:MAG: cupin domain-containing protein [Acidobacteriota bacterium]